MGVHVDLNGTRGGRPLAPEDIWLGADGAHPETLPFTLPDPEAEGVRSRVLSSPPPADRSGVHVWLTMTAGRRVLDLDQEAQERLRALGYLGPN
jgi:hypothetical protein